MILNPVFAYGIHHCDAKNAKWPTVHIMQWDQLGNSSHTS